MKFFQIVTSLILPLSISCEDSFNGTLPTILAKQMKLPKKTDARQTLVLDMDETLIHAEIMKEALIHPVIAKPGNRLKHLLRKIMGKKEEFSNEEGFIKQKVLGNKLALNYGDGSLQVTKRPGLDPFLEQVSQEYELVLYSAGDNEYAKAVLNWIDPQQKFFKHRFYRDYCFAERSRDGNFFCRKHLLPFGRSSSQIFAVDDISGMFTDLPQNQIVIPQFLGDRKDRELKKLGDKLKGGLSVEKVAQLNKEYLK